LSSNAACPTGYVEILRDNARPVPAYPTCGSVILIFNGGISIQGDDDSAAWYTWVESVGTWSFIGTIAPDAGSTPPAAPPSGTSPSGTRVPRDASQITDSGGHIWRVNPNLACPAGYFEVLRDNARPVPAYPSCGAVILIWNGAIFLQGDDDSAAWYAWVDSDRTWSFIGATAPDAGSSPPTPPPPSPSPNGTRVPRDASQVVDSFAHTWKLSPNSICPTGTQEILRDGQRPIQGFASCGSVILFFNGNIYIMRDDGQWYQWNEAGKAWSLAGATAPDSSGSTVTLLFTPSVNDSTNVTSYSLYIFTAGADPSSAKPAASQALGKPPLVNGDMVVDVSSLIANLASGGYFATVTAVGPGGTARSMASNTFAK
jgi:hypothetical protein